MTRWRSRPVAIAVAAALATGLALAFSFGSTWGVEIEERALAIVCEWSARRPQPGVVIVEFGRAREPGADLPREIEALVRAGVAGIGILVPVEGAAGSSLEEDRLAVALRSSKRVALAVRIEAGRARLPPGRLAAQIPLGFREGDLPRAGPLAHRLTRVIGGVPLSSMALASFLAARGRGETELDPQALGRLPYDRGTSDNVVAASAWKDEHVHGRIALLTDEMAHAWPTANALTALLRFPRPIGLGFFDIALTLAAATVSAAAAHRLRGIIALPLVVLVAAAAVASAGWLTARGHPMLLFTPVVAVALSTLSFVIVRVGEVAARRARVRRLLEDVAGRRMAIDLAADPDALEPAQRTVCILVAEWQHPEGADMSAADESRFAAVVHAHGGLIEELRVGHLVALFGCGAAGLKIGEPEAALLGATAALELREVAPDGAIAIGIDVGRTLAGLFGIPRRYRASGEVRTRAERAAHAAAQAGARIAVTTDVARHIETRMHLSPLAGASEPALFELDGRAN